MGIVVAAGLDTLAGCQLRRGTMVELCRYGVRYSRPGFGTILPWPHLIFITAALAALASWLI
jgi:hypothetical protein